MKEFIDKLIERLEELQQCQIEKYTKSLDEGNLACIYDKTDIEDAKVGAVWKVLDNVTQLAEEYNKKQEHVVWLNGCDDDTVFTMEMTNNEYEFLKRVSELANETSTYGCMPRMFVDEEGE